MVALNKGFRELVARTGVVQEGNGREASFQHSSRAGLWKRYRRNKAAVAAFLVLLVVSLTALGAEYVANYEPTEPAVGPPLQPPSARFFMGTDDLGRDIFSGVVHGARVSLLVGFAAAFTAATLGILFGAIAGYFGGQADYLLLKVSELFQSTPRFLLALIFVVFFGATIWNVVVVIGLLSWPRIGRLVRAEFMKLRASEFVMAAKAIGVTQGRVIFRHIFPNVLHLVMVATSLEVGAAIITEAGLSYLGASDPNLMSWGRMIYNAQPFVRSAWWMSVFPGAAIFLTVLSLSLAGDGLTDALNPRLRQL